MPTNIWLGTSLPNSKVVSVAAGTNISPSVEFTIGLGGALFTFTGWNPAAIVSTWNASANPFIKEISASVSGNAVVFTAQNPGEDFEITCSIVNAVANVTSTYQTLTFGPPPSGGTFTITVGGLTTSAIGYSATPSVFAAAMQTAIAALSGFGSTDVLVSYQSTPQNYLLDFSQGRFAGTSVAAITATHTSLTGGNSTTVVTRLAAGNVGVNQVEQLDFPAAGAHLDNVNCVQTLSTTATDGTFTLTLPGYGTTTALPFSAGRSVIKSALEALSGVGPGAIKVSGGPLYWAATATYYPVTITFQGILAGQALPELIVTVVTGGVNEQQQLVMTGSPTTGTFTLSFGGQTTSALAFTATAASIATALQALSSIGAGNLVASGGPLTKVTNIAGVNEVQKLAPIGTEHAGTYTLTFSASTTSTLNLTASVAAVQAALQALGSIGSGNIAVTGTPLLTVSGPVGAANEKQRISLVGGPTSGTSSAGPGNYTLTFGGDTTSTIASTDGGIPTTLQALASIGVGNLLGASTPLCTVTGPFGGTNEVQTIAVAFTGTNTFHLTFGGQSTGNFSTASMPSAATLQAALEGLSSIGSGNVTVTQSSGYVVTFVGTLGLAPQALITRTIVSGSSITVTIAEQTHGVLPTYTYSYATLDVTFASSLGNSPQALITGSSGFCTISVTELVAGSAGTSTYTYGSMNLTFQGSLASSPEALVTSSLIGGSGPPTISRVQGGAAPSTTYAYLPVNVTFQGSLSDAAQALITSTTITGGTVVITETALGGLPSYPVAIVTVGGSTSVQNISGGTFSLSIAGKIVVAPYNVSATNLAILVNTAFGNTVCTCIGGPAPNAPITISFENALGLQPITISFMSSLTTNLPGSVTRTVVTTGAPDPVGTNVWDMVICPGNGTMGLNATDPSCQVWLTLTNTLLSVDSDLYETPVGQIYLPLSGLTPALVEAAINEALASDACRVVRIGHSQEWANVMIPPGDSGYGGLTPTPAQFTNFWYMKDTYRITFINQWAAPGCLSITASFALIGMSPAPATPSAFMIPVSLPGTGADALDYFPEVNRVVIGFVVMEASPTPLHLCSIAPAGVTTLSQVSWRYKLLTQYATSNTNHTGIVDYPSSGQIQFSWVAKQVNDAGEISYTPFNPPVVSTSVDWNSSASTIATVISDMFFGTGNVQVTGSLDYSWLSESLRDAPGVSYQDLKVTLVGSLAGLPIDEFPYELVCTILLPQFNSSTSFQKNFLLSADYASRTLPPHNNQRERITLLSPGSVASLSIGIGNTLVSVSPTATAAQVQAALDGIYSPLPASVASYFPPKLAHPVFVYGTTFADGPMDFEFSSFGLQSSSLSTLQVSAVPTGVIVGEVSTLVQGVRIQDEQQLLTITGNPYAGTFTVSFGGNTTSAIAYNASLATVIAALAAASPSAIVATSVTGSATIGFTFDWAAAGGPQSLITSTSSLSNVGLTIVVSNVGGAGASFTVSETIKGRGPNYNDDFNNWSLGRCLNSGDTAVYDDSPSQVLYGLDMSSVIKVTSISPSTFAHSRARQVFDANQAVMFTGTGTPPSGLTFGTVYLIASPDNAGNFSLSTLMGVPVTITTVGSGNFILAVSSLTVDVYSRFAGQQIGLPHLRDDIYLEYLPAYLKALFTKIEVGVGDGDGIQVGRFDTMNGVSTVLIHNTGSTSIAGINAVLLLANNTGTDVTIDNGDVGLSIYAEESSVFGDVSILQGTLSFANCSIQTLTQSKDATFTSLNSTVGHNINVS